MFLSFNKESKINIDTAGMNYNYRDIFLPIFWIKNTNLTVCSSSNAAAACRITVLMCKNVPDRHIYVVIYIDVDEAIS